MVGGVRREQEGDLQKTKLYLNYSMCGCFGLISRRHAKYGLAWTLNTE